MMAEVICFQSRARRFTALGAGPLLAASPSRPTLDSSAAEGISRI